MMEPSLEEGEDDELSKDKVKVTQERREGLRENIPATGRHLRRLSGRN